MEGLVKGVLYFDEDNGCGGKGGYVSVDRRWCVDVDGVRFHLCYSESGTPGYRGGGHGVGVEEDVRVVPCDGSCVRERDIPEEVVRRALPKIVPSRGRFTEDQIAQLPPRLNGATMVWDLLNAYNAVSGELDRARRRADAGDRFMRSVGLSRLAWFFRKELEQYRADF